MVFSSLRNMSFFLQKCIWGEFADWWYTICIGEQSLMYSGTLVGCSSGQRHIVLRCRVVIHGGHTLAGWCLCVCVWQSTVLSTTGTPFFGPLSVSLMKHFSCRPWHQSCTVQKMNGSCAGLCFLLITFSRSTESPLSLGQLRQAATNGQFRMATKALPLHRIWG